MSIKDLFNSNKVLKVLSKKNMEEVAEDVESVGFLKAALEDKKRFFPQVDFSQPGTFSKFGSAEEYYSSAVYRIYAQYPYDGSLKEKLEWELKSSFLDLQIFENEYPRTNGYAILSSDGWGLLNNTVGDYGESNKDEYINFKGGPNKDPNNSDLKKIFPDQGGIANIYDSRNDRESNLKSDFKTKGVTVEFWLKKDSFDISKTKKEVVFDLWNGQLSSSSGYGRLAIELSGTTASESPFYVTVQSGSSGCFNEQIGVSIAGTGSLEEWKHYAFTFASSSSGVETKFYVNGELNHTKNLGTSGVDEISQDLAANIGGLMTAPSGNVFHGQDMQGWGKLSGSIDEFRFWKTRRSSKDIGRYWFSQVGGGTNTDLANTKLGVYYKFNEGITQVSSVDSVVLDYSGRITNGNWVGYSATSRNTGSAMVISNAAEKEFKDPIIRTSNPTLSNFITNKRLQGEAFDTYNSSQLYKSMPAWIIEDDEEGHKNLLKLTQIMSSYLDTLHLQLDLLPHIHDVSYPSGSLTKISRPLPFAKDLLTSRGLIAPEIFTDATVLEYIGDRDEYREFENDLETIKNTIYKNIYNNLMFIYKSKGTSKSLRNLIRCFGVDDELIKINMYANDYTFTLEDNYMHSSRRVSYADFNHPTRFKANVHQYVDSSNVNSVSYLSASKADNLEEGLAITFETEVLFPKNFEKSSTHFFDNPGTDISLFGAHTVDTSLLDTDTTFADPDVANFKVLSIRTEENSNDVVFKLTGSSGGYFPELTSSIFPDTYNNERWTLAVRVAPTKFPNVGNVDADNDTYTINFYGVNTTFGDVRGEFELTGTVSYSEGLDIVTNPKRFFIGAHRQNITGSIINSSDVKITNTRIWYDYIPNEALKAHALDPANFGTPSPYRRAYLHEDNVATKSISEADTLALHWTFETVTGSDSAGQFIAPDLSSGSIENEERHGWISGIINTQHTGRGFGFSANSSDSIDKEYIFSYRQQLPEILSSDDTVNILDNDDLLYTRDNRPQSFFFAIEKNMYQEISHEMIKMFSTIKDFSNLIGKPVDKYRQNYKSLEKLRQLYFERVKNTPDFERFVEFYKWFDDALSDMLVQLLPASAASSERILTVLESHILERNKYWHKFPTLESKETTPEAGARGIGELLVNWRFEHAPIPLQENNNCAWWNLRAEREGVISSGESDVDSSRSSILSTTLQVLNRRFSTPHRLLVEQPDIFQGGVNSYINKKNRAYSTIKPYDLDAIGAPVGIVGTMESDVDCQDEYFPEDTRNSKIVSITKETKDSGFAEGNNKGGSLTPFQVFNTSTENSWNRNGKEITNLHNDSYGDRFEVPMQSPFTSQHVGGLQHRHVDLATDSSNELNRGEGFKIILGTVKYPTDPLEFEVVQPEIKSSTNSLDMNLPSLRYYRDETAKRPVNIRNIKYSTSNRVLGNYRGDFEIVQTSNRRTNNSWLVYSASSEEVPTPEVLVDRDSFVIGTGSISTLSSTEYTKPSRGKTKHVFVERFSAPGGPETSGDSDGGMGLDTLSAEYSIYNNSNFRNSIVRTYLNERSVEHAGQFGTQQGSEIRELDYRNTASYHKINRNTLRRIELSGSGNTTITGSIRDNLFIQHAIPQSDLGYSWITSSAISAPLGYARDSRLYPTAADTITFLSASSFGLYDDGGDIYFGIDEVDADLNGYPMFYNFDFVGLNIGLSEPIASQTNTIGLDSSEDVAEYINRTVAISLGPYDDYRARVLNSINLNRNGPYGYPTFKQIRTGEYKVARDQRKNNRLDYITAARKTRVLGRPFIIPPVKSTVIEPPLSSRFKPMKHTLVMETRLEGDESDEQEFVLKHTYANNLNYFANKVLDERLTKFGGQPLQNNIRQVYDEITDLYVREATDSRSNPVGDFISLRYKEVIYPREENTFLNRTRSRIYYDVAELLKWRTSRANRASGSLTNSFGEPQTASLWPLDGRFDGTGFNTATSLRVDQVVAGAASPGLDNSGELLNTYAQFHNGTISSVKPSPLYARRDLYYKTASAGEIFAAGDAKWQAAEQSGKTPFYDSYEDFADEIRRYGKDYSIIPEFRISDHIQFLYDSGGNFQAELEDIFKLDGANISSSADPTDIEGKKFYQVYSTSDFLKYFDIVEQDHKAEREIGGANSIKLSCKAIKKFRPRYGFYPAQRTLQLANLFSQSYGDFISYTGSQSSFRAALQPFFAPGIMYNTIKSGIAVDFPIYFGNHDIITLDESEAVGGSFPPPRHELVLHSAGHYSFISSEDRSDLGRYAGFSTSGKSEYILSSSFDARVPFEAILNPQLFMETPICDFEPHPSASLNSTASISRGPTLDLYSLASHNFFAEVPNFYLKNQNFTSIVSKTDRQPLTVEQIQGGGYKEYLMDVVLTAQYGEDTTPDDFQIGEDRFSDIRKTLEMYDNPTAFGPICNSNPDTGPVEYVYSGLLGNISSTASFVDVTPFTPPYYNGFSRVRLRFKPQTATVNFNDILSGITAEYYRSSIANPDSSNLCVTDAMQITASVNVFDPRKCLLEDKLIRTDEEGNIISIDEDPGAGSRWVISTKFETPILDFSGVEREIPDESSPDKGIVPRGMWHQYGEIPTGQEQGIFLQIRELDKQDYNNPLHSGSLADLVGFEDSDRLKKLGQVADSLDVNEAVVAVPFLEGENGQPRFLPIEPDQIASAIMDDSEGNTSIAEMIRKMKKYVFPPKFDFLNNESVEPFAMYIFEFRHRFSQQDLADMWQNLSPEIGTSFEVAEASIHHKILENELIDSQDISGMTNSGKLRWMVFKVKQKAEKDYYKKTINSSDDERFQVRLGEILRQAPYYSYNWPYDYFSLVELVKLEAEVEYTKKED